MKNLERSQMQSNEELLEEVDEYKRMLWVITQSYSIDMPLVDWVKLHVFRHNIWKQIEDRLKLVEQRNQAKHGRYKR